MNWVRLGRLIHSIYGRGGKLPDLDWIQNLDLRHEVAGQQTLRAIYDRHQDDFDLSHLTFARVHEPLCNENVMVSEFMPGHSFDELLEAGSLEYAQLLELFHLHGFFMFCVGTFHGDPHPGNVLLTGDKLCFIDAGFIGHVGPKIRRVLFEFFAVLSEYNYPLCAAALNPMSRGHGGTVASAVARVDEGGGFAGTVAPDLGLLRPALDARVPTPKRGDGANRLGGMKGRS
jgi:hypothetical protein